MKVIIAPDSFKGSITSIEAVQQIRKAFQDISPSTELVEIPMADGGEGTVQATMHAIGGGEIISCPVEDPIGRNVVASYGWFPERGLAIIETAEASGLPLLLVEELNPYLASTYGTGQLIKDALDKGAETIILGLGGSATVDGGVGILQALGMIVLDEKNEEIKRVGGELGRIKGIDLSEVDKRLLSTKLIIASDVSNPLLGKEGAIHIFGRQKGVKEEELELFEHGMTSFSEVVKMAIGNCKRDLPGSGAAGGIGYLLRSIMEVEFKSGLELMLELAGFEGHLEGTDLIITGEGKIDEQSAYGKVPVGIARAAKKHGIPVIAFAGMVDPSAESLYEDGLTLALPIVDQTMTLETAMTRGPELLYKATRRFLIVYFLRM